MKILVLNSGSSSLKFQLFDMTKLDVLASGMIEQIGEKQSILQMQYGVTDDQTEKIRVNIAIANHKQAIETMASMLIKNNCMTGMAELAGIGHRVVHGGESFHQPVIINDNVINTIEELIPLAPLHNPANLMGIQEAKRRAPHTPQIAVFDTAFHQTIPEHGFIYGLPYELYEKQRVRRYGFHGTSHHYVAKKAADYLNRDIQELKLISMHLGNGTSGTAIAHGKSIDTSMGMTPLEGLLMGTRCGDIDPAIPFYLARETGATIQELDDLLNKQSGLKGICGNNDMRSIIQQSEKGDKKSKLALNIFCQRIKKYIGSYLAALNGADAIIFTGGIGENAPIIRAQSCANLNNLGIVIDPEKNTTSNAAKNDCIEIQTMKSPIKVLVIPTNEELEIALQTIKYI